MPSVPLCPGCIFRAPANERGSHRRAARADNLTTVLRRTVAIAALSALVCLGALATVAVSGNWISDGPAGTSLAPSTQHPASIDTAIYDPASFAGPRAELAFKRARDSGATAVRLALTWADVAPRPLPASSDPRDPGNPGYNWASIDKQVKLARQAGLQPILCVSAPPSWARKPDPDGSTALPTLRNPADVGAFMLAAARRYSGKVEGLPRVRYWQVWNEPNVSEHLSPQYSNGLPTSPGLYRQMVNAVADAVHGVDGDNVVIAGGTSPFAQGNAGTDPRHGHVVISPLQFMRELLCMSKGRQPQPTCRNQIRFDVWSHHPYTHGGPWNHADYPDNVSAGDLPKMKSLLDAAVKAGHIRSSAGVGFWVTEFSWDPGKGGPPETLEGQWISEAMYEMWRTGISLVTWFLLRDGDVFQSGLYKPGKTIADDRPRKAMLASFRFPFVGHVVGGKINVWGRTPWAKPGKVVVEESTTTGWQRLGIVTTNKFGMFERMFGSPRGKLVRARTLGTNPLTSQPFPLAGPRDMEVEPFSGQG